MVRCDFVRLLGLQIFSQCIMDRKRNTYEKRLTFESIQPEEKEETDPTDVSVKYMLMCKLF